MLKKVIIAIWTTWGSVNSMQNAFIALRKFSKDGKMYSPGFMQLVEFSSSPHPVPRPPKHCFSLVCLKHHKFSKSTLKVRIAYAVIIFIWGTKSER